MLHVQRGRASSDETTASAGAGEKHRGGSRAGFWGVASFWGSCEAPRRRRGEHLPEGWACGDPQRGRAELDREEGCGTGECVVRKWCVSGAQVTLDDAQ